MGAGGRPRKVTKAIQGHLTKAQRLQREVAESKLKVSRKGLLANVESLQFFSEEAKTEYVRIVTEAAAVELLDNMDMTYVKLYADAWGMYQTCIEELSKTGPTAVQITNNGSKEVPNPALSQYDKSVKTIMQCSSKLGLATTDRLKLIVPEKEEAPVNKFVKFV